MSRSTGLAHSARRIAPLAWPVFIGQLSVVAFATVDTLLVARHSALDLAALAVGAAAYITIFIGLMGVVLAVAPIVGQLFGAGRLAAAGDQLHQAAWLALGLAVLGCTLLVFPQPFLALGQVSPELEPRVSGYLFALAFALPASLLFAAYRGFNNAVSRPKAVMVLQLGGLALKLPLAALLVFGAPDWGVPAFGVQGCGWSTAAVVWLQAACATVLLRRDPFYRQFALGRPGGWRPHRASLKALLVLGVPMGLSLMVEVTGFSFMAIFIARIGDTAVAGHQVAVNLVSVMFMLPMSLSNGTTTLVAQAIGAQRLAQARQLGWHGLALALGVAAVVGSAVYLARVPVVGLYTRDVAVAAAALPLLSWMVLFHIADAAQIMAAFVLRAWRVATLPTVIYVLSLWGLGLGGGYWLAFDPSGDWPAVVHGARGYWMACTAGLTVAGSALTVLLWWATRQRTTPG